MGSAMGQSMTHDIDNRNIAAAFHELERTLDLIAWHIQRTFTDKESANEMADYLADLHRAVCKLDVNPR